MLGTRSRRRAQAALELQRRKRRRRKLFRMKMMALLSKLHKEEWHLLRRIINPGTGGWAGSTINAYAMKGDTHTYQLNFRVS